MLRDQPGLAGETAQPADYRMTAKPADYDSKASRQLTSEGTLVQRAVSLDYAGS